MLMNESEFLEPMQLVYSVIRDIELNPDEVKKTQQLTLNKKRRPGLNGTYGLYGSEEWIENLVSGIIPRKRLSGVIERFYTVGMDTVEYPNAIDVVDDETFKTVKPGIFVNHPSDAEFFKIGKRIEVLYIVEDLKIMDSALGKHATHDFVAEMAVSV